MKINSAKILALAASTFLVAPVSWAIETYDVNDTRDVPFISARIFNTDDGPYSPESVSTWNLSQVEKDKLLLAIKHWAEIIKVIPGNSPAVINIGTYDDPGARAFSPAASDEMGAPTKVQAALNGQDAGELFNGAHGIIDIGTLDFASEPYVPSQIQTVANPQITTVMVHELGHALGIISNIKYLEYEDGTFLIYIPESPNAWTTHLFDDNRNNVRPDQIVYCSFCNNISENDDGEPISDDEIFDLRKNQGYFGGEHVSEVLAGAMPGVPLSLTSPGGIPDAPFLAHLELKNSLMSHQHYRNYTTFMEAEIAILQDLGYDIDRRNFFGYSIYGNNQTLINDNPFFSRNAEGTDYLPNTYNTATLGLGLHVYGSNNTIFQRADLLSAGDGGGGIRVDGGDNAITILPGTRVYADGPYARGVMFAYGTNHTFTQRGDVQALGENGIAASFDFGHNILGDDNESRGSYFVFGPSYRSQEYYEAIYNELNGPLVSTFDLTGRLAGSYASIYISDNAYVGQINVMNGAQISGDIRSFYAEKDENGDPRLTNITFGTTADAEGRSTGQPDASFSIQYNDNIIGFNNLLLNFAGGTSAFTGNHEVYHVNIAEGATLIGQGSYLVNNEGYFINSGTVAPLPVGGSININGDYVQTSTGRLLLALNNTGSISNLIINGHAALDGTIAFAPQRGWYGNGFSVTSDRWLAADSITGSFADMKTVLDSPTLQAAARADGNNTYTVTFSRAADAYSRYSSDKNSLRVGMVFDRMAGSAGAGLHSLISSLDFSASDGSTINAALHQLSGEAYASVKGALSNSSSYSRSAVYNRLVQAYGGTPSSPIAVMAYGQAENAKSRPANASDIVKPASVDVSFYNVQSYAAWGNAFGGWTRQSGDGNAASAKSTIGGFMSGIDALVYDTWRLGILAGYSHSTFKVDGRSSSGRSDNYTLGGYTGNEWAVPEGAIAFRSGLAFTWHDLDMSRNVAFPGFNDSLSADYNAGTFQIFGEFGYRLDVNERSSIEPYANLAYVHLRTDGFRENGLNGAALNIHSDTMNTTLSALGIRASTNFDFGGIVTTARADLAWRHAFGDSIPLATASFAAGSGPFTVAGTSIGKDMALVETGLDFQLSKDTTLGVSYQGQFGSGVTQNGVNANLIMRF
ncbi:autotransporter outer membrane beta-barrel domain-containing protein [Pseudochelatococcus sp. G4_1912]|uniref:autotransporter family protein n=1 Tax=Pseudochelatococcus sp. G4_1912 TaxID=3114288 RepID=UPI0039C6FBB4